MKIIRAKISDSEILNQVMNNPRIKKRIILGDIIFTFGILLQIIIMILSLIVIMK